MVDSITFAQEMVNILVSGEEYDKVFNHLDMLNAPFEGKVFTCAKQVKPYGKFMQKIVLLSSNRGSLLGIIDLMIQKNKRMKQKDDDNKTFKVHQQDFAPFVRSPLLKQYKVLKVVGKSFGIAADNFSSEVYGFGVCLVTKDPIIVEIIQTYKMPWRVKVVIDRFIYWGGHEETTNDGEYTTNPIDVSFDLITKKFKVVDLPHNLRNELDERHVVVANLKESLVVCGSIYADGAECCDVWVMERDSFFRKLFTIAERKKMHFMLFSMSVVYVLTTLMPDDGGENPTVKQVRKRAKWDNDDYVCRGLILNDISDSLFDIYQDVETSKELWDTLEAKYMAEDASSKKFLVSNFINYKMTDSRLVLEQYNKLLEILGRFIQHKMNIDKSNQVSCFIDKLPPSWKEAHLETFKGGINSDRVGQYNDNKGKRKHHDTRASPNKKLKVTCWKCGKLEHLKKDCKAGNVGNIANGSNTKGSEDGSSNPQKGQSMFNKSHQIYYVTYVFEAFFVHDDDVAWLNIISDNIGSAFMSTSKLNDSILWHARLGHVHFKRMQNMSKDGLIPTIDMDAKKCKTCMLTKITKKPFQNVKREAKVLELIHSNLCDLCATLSLGNKKYFVTFTDDASRLCYVYLLHSKNEALDKFKVFKTEVELQQESLIKRFRTDRGVAINSIIESMDVIFDEHKFSSVLKPSQRSRVKGTEDSGEEAINDEMDSIMGNNTWVLTDLPPGCRTLACKWIFKRKLKVDGTVEKFKARLVIQSFKQKSGINYFDTYASVTRISTIRLLIAMTSIHNLIIHQIDVKTAFLNGKLEDEVYMNQSLGFIMPGNENKVCKLIKSLYGLKQGPKKWHQKFDEMVLSNGYLLNQADKCVFSKFDPSGKGVIICLYVDDILIFGTDQVQMDLTKEFLSSRFSMKDIGEADVILGIRIKHESNGIAISQSHYIGKVLKKFNYSDCTLVRTSLDTCEKLMPNRGLTVSQLEYSRVIGCLMYVITCTRPDIAFAVGKLSRYTSNPETQHWQAIQRVLKYLKKTIEYRMVYSGYPSVLEGYTDASWISNTEDSSSTSDWVFLLGGGAISCASKKKTCITGSTMESEFVALTTAGKEAKCAATCAKAYSQMYNGKSRHLSVIHSMIRELITNGVVSIEFVRSQQNLADHLTKGLARDLVIKSAKVAVTLSCMSVQDWSCPFCPKASDSSPLQMRVLGVSVAYLIYDLVCCLFGKNIKIDNLLHHFVSIVGIGASLVYKKSGSETLAALCITEMSSPFLHFRELLRELGYKGTYLNLAADVSFAVTFTVARMFFGPYLCYVTLSANNPILIKAMGLGLQLVSAFWFYKIATMVKHKLIERSTSKTS
nr:zinc finger, CCHC-type [Tanacetum cinerariifolium]